MSKETKKIPSAEKKSGKKFNVRKLKYGSAATAVTLIVIAVVVVVNVLISAIGERTDLTIDLTSESAFEISQETKDYIASLNEDVEIVAMQDETIFQTTTSTYYKQAYEVLKKYELNSSKINVEFVDMTANPTYANKYQEMYKGTISENSIVITCGNRIKVISLNDLFNTEFSYQTFSTQIISSKAEQVLTSAIMYVTDPEPKQAAVLNVETAGIAHETVQALLEDDGFDVTLVNPLTEEFPMDADMIDINAPLNDFSEELIDKLYDYMENGGNYGKNMIYLASFSQKATENIDAFLAEWGISISSGVVGDTNQNNLISTNTFYAIRNYIQANDYSANVAQPELPVVSYNARPIEILFETSGNVSVTPLLTTDETAFELTAEMQEMAENGEEPDITTTMGSYNTMVLSNKYTFDSDNVQRFSNLLVMGSSDMIDSYLTSTTYYNNGDYFVSAVNKMNGKEDGITIVAKELGAATFDTDVGKMMTSLVWFMIIIPLAIVITGITVWFRRRHR